MIISWSNNIVLQIDITYYYDNFANIFLPLLLICVLFLCEFVKVIDTFDI